MRNRILAHNDSSFGMIRIANVFRAFDNDFHELNSERGRILRRLILERDFLFEIPWTLWPCISRFSAAVVRLFVALAQSELQ